jgi:hypothetical protein
MKGDREYAAFMAEVQTERIWAQDPANILHVQASLQRGMIPVCYYSHCGVESPGLAELRELPPTDFDLWPPGVVYPVVLFELYHAYGHLDTFTTFVFRPRINVIGVKSGPLKPQTRHNLEGP